MPATRLANVIQERLKQMERKSEKLADWVFRDGSCDVSKNYCFWYPNGITAIWYNWNKCYIWSLPALIALNLKRCSLASGYHFLILIYCITFTVYKNCSPFVDFHKFSLFVSIDLRLFTKYKKLIDTTIYLINKFIVCIYVKYSSRPHVSFHYFVF